MSPARIVRPVFYGRFHCLADRCRHSCCRGWEIDVDEDTRLYYESLPGELGRELREALVREDDGAHFQLTGDERCPFLRADGLCRLILELGEQALCEICTEHPRFYLELGGWELWGLGLSCEAAAALLLESREPLLFEAEGQGLLDLAELTQLLGHPLPQERLCFRPFEAREDWQALLALYARTEPIDRDWTELLEQLFSRSDELIGRAACRERWDKALYDRIYQYILYRELPRLEQAPPEALAAYARRGAAFVFLLDAIEPDTAGHLRRWSEQIEYSTENVDLLFG